jgi:hypothetical protein
MKVLVNIQVFDFRILSYVVFTLKMSRPVDFTHTIGWGLLINRREKKNQLSFIVCLYSYLFPVIITVPCEKKFFFLIFESNCENNLLLHE